MLDAINALIILSFTLFYIILYSVKYIIPLPIVVVLFHTPCLLQDV